MGRRHVGQMLEQPERERSTRPAPAANSRHVECPVGVHAPHDRIDQLADIDRRDSRPHADAEPRRDRACRYRGPASSTAIAAAPTANRTARLISFSVLLVLAQVGQHVEVLDLAGDLDRQARRVEALDVI